MFFIANITWKKYDWLLEETLTDKDCAIFGTRKEAEAHLAACHADPMLRPDWRIDETWIEEEEE